MKMLIIYTVICWIMGVNRRYSRISFYLDG